MTISTRRALARVIVVSVCVLGWSSAASAQDEAFKRGLQARDDKKWSEAASAMLEAIKADPKESAARKVRVGVGRLVGLGGTEYLPHYFLAEALKAQNDCAGAVTALENSEEQKEVLKAPEFARNIPAWYKECAAKGVLLRDDFRRQVASGDQAYNEASAVLTRILDAQRKNPQAWRADMDADLARGQTDLGLAQKALVKARESRVSADFTESRQATTRAANVLRPLEARLNAVITNIGNVQAQSREVQQIIAAAEETDRAIDAERITLTAPLAASRDGARQALAQARERLGAAGEAESVGLVRESQKLARSASDALGRILDEARKIASDLRAEQLKAAASTAAQELLFLESSFARLDRLFSEKQQMVRPDMVDQRDRLQKDLASAKRRLENARGSASLSGVQDATRLASETRMRLDALITVFGPATLRDRGVVAELEQGADHYLKGNYQQALAALAPLAGVSDVLLQPHVYVFRAASLYALYVASGEAKPSLRDEARDAIERCRQIDPGFQPDPRAFSPRFIAFFQSVGASNAPASTAGSSQ